MRNWQRGKKTKALRGEQQATEQKLLDDVGGDSEIAGGRVTTMRTKAVRGRGSRMVFRWSEPAKMPAEGGGPARRLRLLVVPGTAGWVSHE